MYTLKQGGATREWSPPTFPKPPVHKNPGWAKALRNGQTLPVTPWTRCFCNAKPGTVDATIGWRIYYKGDPPPLWWRDHYVGHFLPVMSLPGYTSPSYYSVLDGSAFLQPDPGQHHRLTLEAVDAAKNSAWDIGTFAAEAHKSYDLVRHAHTRTVSRAAKILSRKVGRVKTLAEFADAWLEYRYGWRILQYDLESAQDSVKRLQEKSSLIRQTSYAEESASVSKDLTHVWLGDTHVTGQRGGAGDLKTHINMENKIEYRVGAGVRVDRAHGATINPVLTGWELIPYSFIMDWFVDVGTYIGAHTPTFGRKLDYVWGTTRQVRTETASLSYNLLNGDSDKVAEAVLTASPSYVEYVRYDRFKIPNTLPALPSTNLRLNLEKFADLGALAFKQRDPFKIQRR